MVSGMQVVVMVQIWFLDGHKVAGVRVELVQEVTLHHEGFVDALLSDHDAGHSISIRGGWDWPHHAAMSAWQWWGWVLPGVAVVGGN